MKPNIVYLRMRPHIYKKLHETVRIKDVIEFHAPENLSEILPEIPLHQTNRNDEKFVVIDLIDVVRTLRGHGIDAEIESVGGAQTIVEILSEKKKMASVYFLAIWLLLFFGSALAIMNFHEDVSMRAVHEKLYRIITGQNNPHPLIMQIPYSIGLGIGMILFFNHLFKKRLNEEPSPLEVEMFNYEQDIDRYVVFHDKKSEEKARDF